MADFLKFLPIVTKNEGLYDNDPDDPGGETCWGLTRRDEPQWEGWPLIDEVKKSASNPNNAVEVRALLKPLGEKLRLMTATIYKPMYWDVIGGDRILSQQLANKFAEQGVVQGTGTAIRMMETSLGITRDGKLDDELINMLNATL